MTDWRTELQTLVKAYDAHVSAYDAHGGRWPQHHGDGLFAAVEHARAALARYTHQPAPPAAGAVADLRGLADYFCGEGYSATWINYLTHAANLIENQEGRIEKAYQYGRRDAEADAQQAAESAEDEPNGLEQRQAAPVPAPAAVEEAAHIRRMCDIILGSAFGNEELDSLALLVGHHPDVLNALPAPVPVAEGEMAELALKELEQTVVLLMPVTGHKKIKRFDTIRAALKRLQELENKADLSPASAPAEGEVAELVEWLREEAHYQGSPPEERPSAASRLTRAADLLEQRHPTPVPVSERANQIEDLAADAVSALRYIEQIHGRLYGIGWDRVYEKAEHLGPAHALPLLPEDAHVIEPTKHTILAPVPAPVPVAERLPGPEDCDAEGRCWWFCTECPGEHPYWILAKEVYCDPIRWLPYNALPLPGGKVKP